eukprot:2112384-Prymnesium_polylepis.1
MHTSGPPLVVPRTGKEYPDTADGLTLWKRLLSSEKQGAAARPALWAARLLDYSSIGARGL